MMKATDTKSSARTAQQQKQPAGNAFFNKESSNSFFGESETEAKPFFVQRKLTVGKPDDHYEKQADHVADQVVQRMSQPQTLQLKEDIKGEPVAENKIQRKPIFDSMAVPVGQTPSVQAKTAAPVAPVTPLQLKEEIKEEEPAGEEKIQRKPIFDSMGDPPEDNIQRKSEGNDTGTEASSGVESRLKSSKGSGSPLPADTKTAMESSIGADFSGVRIHTGTEAASLSNDLQAQAFTHGNDIYFNEGKYDAGSNSGRHLLAHELTHTVQQGAAVQKKPDLTAATATPDVQLAANSPANPVTVVPGEVVNVGSGTFNPSLNLREAIRATKHRGLDLKISGGKIAGTAIIKVREVKGELESMKDAYLPLNIPILNAASPVLAVKLIKGDIQGYATVGQGKLDGIASWLRAHGKDLTWLTGIDLSNIPAPGTNTFDSAGFQFTLNGIRVKVGGLAEATMDLGFVNLQPAVHVGAKIDVGGIAEAAFDINMSKDGIMSGEGSFGIMYKSFAGNIDAKFINGVMDVKGLVSYDSDRLKGSITLIMTDKKTADNFAKTQLDGVKPEEAVLPEAVPAAEGKGPRGMAGIGSLTFNMTEWFAGSVNVIVDGKGCVTVIGKIAPPKEIKLFDQKPYDKELFKLSATAGYGIPLLGTIGVFAEVSLSAIARVGPGTISKIEISGTYSNNPEIAKSISLSGSLNISAYAGLRLRAAGGVVLTILGHDLKAGVAVNADAGVKGYVDARPTIGYRDPGEFFFKGHMEIVAQPVLGLSGEFFVELDSPWYSPLPDKRWPWPIGSLEYPLPGEFGLGADIDYVLGSGKVPEINFTDAKFDASKFMTDLVDDNVPKKGGADQKDKQGKFVDGNAAPKPPVTAAAPAPPTKKGAKPVPVPKGGAKDKPKGKLDEMKNFGDAMQKIKALEGHKPMTREEITSTVEKIKSQYKIPGINVIPKGTDKWKVTGSLAGKKNKQSVYVPANMKPGDEKNVKGNDKEKAKQLDAGLKALKQEDKQFLNEDKAIEKEEAAKVAGIVKSKHPIFKSITVIDGGATWDYEYVQAARAKGDKKEKNPLALAKKKFGKKTFGPGELIDYLIDEGFKKKTMQTRKAEWIEAEILFSYQSKTGGVRDSYKIHSFDKTRLPKGDREVSDSNRDNYGYRIKFKKTDSIAKPILQKSLIKELRFGWKPGKENDMSYLTSSKARYECAKTKKTYGRNSDYKRLEVPFEKCILGHAGEGASGHWNLFGHKQTKEANEKWNKMTKNYHGMEDKDVSDASGGSAQRYLLPTRARKSHPMWWNTKHPDYFK